MLYSKQEWFKTREEINAVFGDLPEALENTCSICDQVEFYSIFITDLSCPVLTFPEEFGTEEEYRKNTQTKICSRKFTQNQNGEVVMDRDAAEDKGGKVRRMRRLYRLET